MTRLGAGSSMAITATSIASVLGDQNGAVADAAIGSPELGDGWKRASTLE